MNIIVKRRSNMHISATELMKRLKYIEEEINDIHHKDEESSYVPVSETREEGKVTLTPLYESTYNFLDNRNRIKELHEEERQIKRVLNQFNNDTKVIGYDFSIAEGLVRIAELKGEIRVLTNMTKNGEYFTDIYRSSSNSLKKVVFDIKEAKETLKNYQKELSALQVAVDRTNLNSSINY